MATKAQGYGSRRFASTGLRLLEHPRSSHFAVPRTSTSPAHACPRCSDLYQHPCSPTSCCAPHHPHPALLPPGLCGPHMWHVPPVTGIPPFFLPAILWRCIQVPAGLQCKKLYEELPESTKKGMV